MADNKVDGNNFNEVMNPGYTDADGDSINGSSNTIFGNEGDDTINAGGGNDVVYGDTGDSPSAGGTNTGGSINLSNQLDSEQRVDGTLYGRFPGTVYDGLFNFSSDAFYLGDDIGILDGANRNELRGQIFSQDGAGTNRVAELVDINYTGAQKSFVGLATVQRTALHGANDQFAASNGDGFQDVVIVNDVDVTFRMNDGAVFQGIRMQFLRGEDGKTYLLADDHPQQGIARSIRTGVFNNDSGIESFQIESSSGNINGINPMVGNWAAGQFYEVLDGEGGDDIITGGDGADQLFGEGGNDTFVVGSAAEGAGDEIVGGNGPDQNTDNDVLDLRGAGPVTINDEADETDAGARKGTVEFGNGATLEFSQIETILQDEPELIITPNGDVDANGNPVTEENGQPTSFLITRTGPTDEALVVTLTSDDTTEATVPTTVTIPAGATSITVPVTPVDDPLLDGTQFPTITANATGFDPVTVDVAVLDDDTAPTTITISPAPGTPVDDEGRPVTTENGAPAQIVVSLDAPALEDTVITLTDGDTTETDAPATVTIPAGETSVTVDVPSVDDPDVDGTQIAPITATAPDLTPDTIEVAVLDDDEPTLIITPAPNTTVDENGNPVTQENGDPVEVVITRTGPLDEPLTVTLGSDDPTEATAPQTVEIPAGQASVTVPVTPVDDPDVDGDQTPIITATAPGFDPVEQPVVVEDNDVPAEPELTIAPAPGTPVDDNGNPVTSENGDPVEVVITRTGPLDEPLTVTLGSDDPTEATAPQTVEIPAGQASVTVPVTPVDDPDVDGDQTPIITATAPGFDPVEQPVVVQDDDAVVNQGPNAVDDDIAASPVGTPVVISPAELLGNDFDPEGDDFTGVSIQDPVNGTVEFDGTNVIFTPTPGYEGPASFTYTIEEVGTGKQDTATVNLTIADAPVLTITPADGTPVDDNGNPVTSENGDPVEVVITRTGPLDEPLTVTLGSDDPTEATAPQTVEIPAGQASVTVPVTPVDDPDVDGDQTPIITATAPGFDPVEQPVVVQDDDAVVNQGPNAVDDDIAASPVGTPVVISPAELLGNDFDPEGDDFTGVSIQDAVNGTVEFDGTNVIFTPTPGYEGPASFTYTIEEVGTGKQDTATVNLTIADAPVLTITPADGTPVDDNGNPVTSENGDPVEVVITRTGPLDEPLTVTLGSDDPTEAAVQQTVEIPAGQASVTVPVTPVDDPDVDGDQTPIITATAPGFDPVEQPVVVEDNDGAPANRAPDAIDDILAPTEVGVPVVISPATLLAGDYDPDGDEVIPVGFVGTPSNGTVEFDGTNVIFTPVPGYQGPASFQYQITDGKGGFDTAVVNLTIVAPSTLIEGDPNDNHLNGTNGDDVIIGYAGDDEIIGGDGDDVIYGGRGNDLLNGGLGADTFVFTHDDIKPIGNGPEVDILHVDANDKLDLRDLLEGEEKQNEATIAESLDNYLHFTVNATGDTVISASVSGDFADEGDAGREGSIAGNTDQTIILAGFDATAGDTLSDIQVLNNLLGAGHLITDAS